MFKILNNLFNKPKETVPVKDTPIKDISEPTYLLAEAISKGVVKVYVKNLIMYYHKVILVLPDNKIIDGTYTDYSNHYYENKLCLTAFNTDECEYLLPFIKEAIERKEKEKAAKELAEQQAKDVAVRKQITEALSGKTP